jgi:ParB-like chromosome segregation protein Spo0J
MPIVNVKYSDCVLHGSLPRDKIYSQHVAHLANKLRRNIELPPPKAIKQGGRYEIVSGVHRFLAHGEVGAVTLDLMVTDKPLSAGELKCEQWGENHDRQGFSLSERAALLQGMMSDFKCTQAQLPALLGDTISEGYVSKVLRTFDNSSPKVK